MPKSTADRVLAIDYGTKRLGFAVSDEAGPRPLETWTRKDAAQDRARVEKHISDWEVHRVVVGRPTMLDGQASPATERADAFREELADALDLPVEAWDEALTSWAADERMAEAGVPPKQRKAQRDAYAALILLEDYLATVGGQA